MSKKKITKMQSNNKPIILVSILFILVLAFLLVSNMGKNSEKNTAADNGANQSKIQASLSSNSRSQTKGDVTSGVDLKILKSEVTETVKFYPYKVDNVNMEEYTKVSWLVRHIFHHKSTYQKSNVLPVLYGDRIIARFEPEIHRGDTPLVIKNWWWENRNVVTDEVKS